MDPFQSEVTPTLRGLPHSSQHCPGDVGVGKTTWGVGALLPNTGKPVGLVKVC